MKKSKPYWEMNAKELAEATREFDGPISSSKMRSLTRSERRQFEKMQKAPSRSIFISRDANGVWVRLDPDILARTTQYAARSKLTLSQVINRSLKGLLSIVD